jgi:nucleoside-diphosphate-sugar epimerase
MHKKILILGSSGFIGQNIKKLFINKYSDINSISNKYYIYSTNRKEVDILQKEKLDDYFKKIKPEIVINCSGIVGSSIYNLEMNDYEIFSKNMSMQMNILDCCEKYEVEKVIFLSTYRIFGENIHEKYNETNIHSNYDMNINSGYLLSKKMLHLQVELFCKHNPNIKYVCLILPNIFGKFDSFIANGRIVPAIIRKIEDAKKKDMDLIIHSNPNTQINLIYVEDLFPIIEKCLQDDCKNENILVFNEKGIWTLDKLVNSLKKTMAFEKEIIFTDCNLNNNNNNFNIMSPDISKFKSFLKDFEFSNLEISLKDTLDYFYIFETGIS